MTLHQKGAGRDGGMVGRKVRTQNEIPGGGADGRSALTRAGHPRKSHLEPEGAGQTGSRPDEDS